MEQRPSSLRLAARTIRGALSRAGLAKAATGRGPARKPFAHAIEVFWCDRDGAYLEGWIHAYDKRILRLRVAAGEDAYEIASFAPRPDVLSHYADFPNSGESGFKLYLPWRAGTPLTFEVVTADDRFVETIELPRSSSSLRTPFCLTDGSAWRDPHPEQGPAEEAYAAFQREVNERALVVAEVGARVVSSQMSPLRAAFAGAERYIGIDIHAAPNVDVVGDAHYIDALIGRDAAGAVFSLSVMEHLAQPWLFAYGVNRALRVGGLTYHLTHQTWPLHEEPNDFWRFSDEGLKVLFGPATGFEVLAAGLSSRARIYPDHRQPAQALMPLVSAFGGAFVLARKVRDLPDGAVAWPTDQDRSEERARHYPQRG
ncbi:hypothetical protein Sp245p_26550 (plasmid) [Azospirillum baldaniorum]|uniref:Methyltransferase type 11 domain-containing protein n=1 Tax=Azospirillum baldaniorum TaxID=1064539 RepID=A0A9P1K1Y7_9PROT|nr:hypothetical protein [Azospirillum baldaniorum]TWA70307.1 hypothetical protein FBZ85_12530 [Azospirillum brasilense]AWJ93423.1 hypothetical protein Sp245p_26550 [Azospirillum baldaniorum]NUB08650.1 hypothetical protein [Azospirillum baldaniorum]TWA53828.1 hypothetical protein FBZ84_13116 [Azospirillum baldaniorum]CCD04022.1 conserved protein of unknown function [Azospirillum baldaniorum]